MKKWRNPLSNADEKIMHPDALALLKLFELERLPVEGTFYKNTYRSAQKTSDGTPIGTAMIGMYCNAPLSVSCFHRLVYDEIWHVYGGDPFELILLHPDGSGEKILMGCNPILADRVQWVVPANTWQAGSLVAGGRYALFGCTMAPGFSGSGFEAAIAGELIAKYPVYRNDIIRLSVNGIETHLPDGFLG
jgi:predicted cupin superfamily sugar epimerase